MNRKKAKVNALLSIVITAAVLVVINILGQSFFKRFDLTDDQRHSLRSASIEMVEELEQPVFVKVYLEGEFPAEFKRLRDAVKQLLDELRAYAGSNIQYEFINPSQDADPVARKEMYTKLSEAGLTYTNLTFKTKEGVEEKILFPGAIITYAGGEIAWQILKTTEGIPGANLIENSIQNLEYNLLSTINQVTQPIKKRIAWIRGHNEVGGIDAYDIVEHLAERHVIFDVEIEEKLDALLGYDLIIVAGPKDTYSEKDKFIIDQFIMKGGKAIFMVDGIELSMDSLQNRQYTFGLAARHNLWDMLFNYGVRVKKDVILDAACAPIPINVGQFGDQPNLQLFPWYFHPTLIPKESHPIVTNVSPILGQFTSSVDTVGAKGIRKKILLRSSNLTLRRMAPARVSLNIVSVDQGFEDLSIGATPVAVLLEGKFKSLYANRIPPRIANNTDIAFTESALVDSRILVLGDGDIAKNYSSADDSRVFPLGYDKYLRKNMYGNKQFLTNAVDYLLNDEKLINIRSKEIIIRKLNEQKVFEKEGEIQFANLGLPVLLVGLLVILFVILKKRLFT